jgi:hypothetical protein
LGVGLVEHFNVLYRAARSDVYHGVGGFMDGNVLPVRVVVVNFDFDGRDVCRPILAALGVSRLLLCTAGVFAWARHYRVLSWTGGVTDVSRTIGTGDVTSG